MIKFLSYFIQSIFIYFFFLIGRVLGLKLSRKIFANLFNFFGPIFRSKKIINKNLENVFKESKSINRQDTIKGMWKNYGKTFIEYIFLSNFRNHDIHMNIIGAENLNSIKKNKKPVIFISGHFANFELMSMEITKKNISLATIYRPLNNFFLNPFMEYLRKKYICKNQIKKGINGLREAIAYINNKYSLALMIDQRLSEGENIEFFGRPALTTTLPAQLSIKYNMNIIPVFIKRESDEKFIIEFYKEINPNNFKNKIDLTLKLNKILEAMILKNPSQWIWTHNRWK